MKEPLLIGALVGFLVGNLWDIHYHILTKKRFFIRTLILILTIIASLFVPNKVEAWCNNCIPLTSRYYSNVSRNYQYHGEQAERLILEIKEITDEYAMNGSDVFMASVGSAMAALPSGCDPRAIFVSMILANTATYFCKTVECHWKTVHLIDELEFHLFSFKKLGDELLHSRILCFHCHEIYFKIHYMGARQYYLDKYPHCCFSSEGCTPEYDELYPEEL
jgi:hypothetical protein